MRRVGMPAAALLLASVPAGPAQESLAQESPVQESPVQEGPAPYAPVPYAVEGDAIAAPLAGRSGDPARGEALMADRQKSLCLLCHAGPFPDPHLHGTLGPDLTGVGRRYTEGQIRLRLVDMKRINPATIMPSYHRVEEDRTGTRRIAAAWHGRPVLAAGEIEDLVAYLVTLKE